MITFNQISIANYAPLTINGVTQPYSTGQPPLEIYPSPSTIQTRDPIFLPAGGTTPGQLIVQLGFSDGIGWTQNVFTLRLRHNGNPQLVGTWQFDRYDQGDPIYEMTFSLTAWDTLLPWNIMLGTTTMDLEQGDGSPLPITGCPQMQLYTGPGPALPAGQGTDLGTLHLNVARDMAAQMLTSDPTPQQIAQACTVAAYSYPPSYGSNNNYFTCPTVTDPTSANFDLQDWLFVNSGLSPNGQTANCYDSTAMCLLLLALQNPSGIRQAWAGDISPFGWLKTPVTVRGGPPPASLGFGDHMVAMVDWGATDSDGNPLYYVCDATLGQHLATETPDEYLQDTLQWFLATSGTGKIRRRRKVSMNIPTMHRSRSMANPSTR